MIELTDYIPERLYKIILSVPVLAFWTVSTLAYISEGVYTGNIYLLYGISAVLLGLFTVYRFRYMNSPQGVTWRRILFTGTVVNMVTAASIYQNILHEQLFVGATVFWLAASGYGFKIVADFADGDTSLYTILTHLSSFLVMFFLLGVITETTSIQALSTAVAAVSQTAAVFSYAGK